MKLKEFMALSESDKVERLDAVSPNYREATEDVGKCFICGRKLGVGYYCFGCQRLVCLRCDSKPKHLDSCR